MNGMNPRILRILESTEACLCGMALECFWIEQESYLKISDSIMEKSVI